MKKYYAYIDKNTNILMYLTEGALDLEVYEVELPEDIYETTNVADIHQMVRDQIEGVEE